jgi:4-hydroxybenzoate polyprenyltransferase
MSFIRHLLRLMRPHQWVKNLFVFTGLIFGHAWGDSHLLWSVVLAAAAFSLLSSGVYIVNDIADVESDRQHPRKRLRPLAAGDIAVTAAAIAAAVLIGAAFVIAWIVAPAVAALLLIYFLINTGYSLGLKHVPILDVFLIAAGFMLRILVGTAGVGIAPSQWLLLCGLMITLFLGFAKRRAELLVALEQGTRTRKVLVQYDGPLLDVMIAITATSAVITYGLYTMNPETVRIQGTPYLIYTLPFVLYGIMRYIFRLHHHRRGEDPARELFTDPHLIATVLGWAAVTFWLIR